MPLAASYPGAIKTYTEVVDNVTEMTSTDINPVYCEVTAIETELGTDVAGSKTDLKTRLANSLDAAGMLDFATATELTISGGAITPTQNWHIVDTEGDASADDLTTIGSTDSGDGFILWIRQANDARDVTIKHGTGNIYCPGAVDIAMTDTTQVTCMIYDVVVEKWLVISAPANTARVNASNAWTKEQLFTYGIRVPYISVSTDTTLTAAHYMVDVDASGGAKTITLPTAVAINGRVYVIRKSDSSGNAVTIDGDGGETINGAGTKALAAQYDTYTIISNGTGWDII